MAKSAVWSATLRTLLWWGVALLCVDLMISWQVADKRAFFEMAPAVAGLLACLCIRIPLSSFRMILGGFAILLVFLPMPDLRWSVEVVADSIGAGKPILEYYSVLIFVPMALLVLRLVVGAWILLLLLGKFMPLYARVDSVDPVLRRMARRAVHRLSMTVLLILLWGVGAVWNLPMLLASWAQIAAGGEVDRMVYVQFFGVLVPMLVAGGVTLTTGVVETFMMVWRRDRLAAWWTGRRFLWLSRTLVVLLALPMLGDTLLFGAYFLYPLRVLAAIVALVIIGRRWTYARMGQAMADAWLDCDTVPASANSV